MLWHGWLDVRPGKLQHHYILSGSFLEHFEGESHDVHYHSIHVVLPGDPGRFNRKTLAGMVCMMLCCSGMHAASLECGSAATRSQGDPEVTALWDTTCRRLLVLLLSASTVRCTMICTVLFSFTSVLFSFTNCCRRLNKHCTDFFLGIFRLWSCSYDMNPYLIVYVILHWLHIFLVTPCTSDVPISFFGIRPEPDFAKQTR